MIDNLNNDTISVFGHAGMGIGFKFPINSYESFEPCLRIGADGTELDVQLTKDSVLVVYHHQKLKDGTLCEGVINEKNWSEINGCNLASPFSNHVNLLTFDDLITRLRNDNFVLTNRVFTFDCKLYTGQTNLQNYYGQFTRAVANAVAKYHLEDNLFVESTDTSFIRCLKTNQPSLKLFIYPSSFDEGLKVAQFMGLYGITIHTDNITKEQIREAHKKDIRITLWGLTSDEDNLKAIDKSPDYVQTDRIIHLLKVFDKYRE